MAPEIISANNYSVKSDVYAFAIIMFEVLSRATPYSEIKNKQSIYNLVQNNK